MYSIAYWLKPGTVSIFLGTWKGKEKAHKSSAGGWNIEIKDNDGKTAEHICSQISRALQIILQLILDANSA